MLKRGLAPLSLAVVLLCTGCHAEPGGMMHPFTTSSSIPKSIPNSAAAINWVRYNDSAEGAFSMDVPYGWQIKGGMWRFGYFDVRWGMDFRSLDGKVLVRIDDPNIPPYVLPGPHSGRAGQPYFKPQQFQMMVSDFQQARPYAETYARRRFGSVCTSMAPRAAAWSPTMPPAWHLDPGTQATQASIAYDCSTSDGPRIAEIFLRTTMPRGNTGLWLVDPVISILASPETLPLAHAMVQHMIETWQKSPQWEQYQQQMTQRGLDQIRANFGQFMQQMQVYHQQREAAMNQQIAGYERRQNAQARQVSGFCEVLTGQTTLRDPNTGTQFQVFSGPKSNYYTNGLGQTVNSNISPGPGFHQVNQVRP